MILLTSLSVWQDMMNDVAGAEYSDNYMLLNASKEMDAHMSFDFTYVMADNE